MSNTLKHAFTSLVVDDPDTTLVRPLNWNDEHKFNGGANGNILIRDSTQTDGARWGIKDALFPDASESLSTLVTNIGASISTIGISGIMAIPLNLTIPKNITLWFVGNGQLSQSAGTTLTINGPIQAAAKQIFTGSINVRFGSLAAQEVYVEWFGAVGDNVTDDGAAFQAAFNAITATGSGLGGKIKLQPTVYLVNTAVVVPSVGDLFHAVDFEGASWFAGRSEVHSTANIAMFKLVGQNAQVGNDFRVHGIYFGHDGVGANTKIFDLGGQRLDHVCIDHCGLVGNSAGGTLYGVFMNATTLLFDFSFHHNICAFFDTNDLRMFRTGYATVGDNQFIDVAAAFVGQRIYVGDTAGSGTQDSIVIADNVIITRTGAVGLNLVGNPAAIVEGIAVTGNVFQGSGGTGINQDHDGCKSVALVGNQFDSSLTNAMTSGGTITTNYVQLDRTGYSLYDASGVQKILASLAGFNVGNGTTIKKFSTPSVSVTPGTVNVNSTSDITATLTGAAVGDIVQLQPHMSMMAGLVYCGCVVSSANTITIRLANVTAANITDSTARDWLASWCDVT